MVGLYLQDEVRLFERFSLIGGVRWDHFARQARGGGLDQQAGEVTFRAGGIWRLTDWLSLHLANNGALRAPDLNELFVSGIHFTCGPGCANLFVPNPGLDPEKARNQEVGLRIHQQDLWLEGDALRVRTSFFRNQVDDFIETVVRFSQRPVPPFNPGLG